MEDRYNNRKAIFAHAWMHPMHEKFVHIPCAKICTHLHLLYSLHPCVVVCWNFSMKYHAGVQWIPKMNDHAGMHWIRSFLVDLWTDFKNGERGLITGFIFLLYSINVFRDFMSRYFMFRDFILKPFHIAFSWHMKACEIVEPFICHVKALIVLLRPIGVLYEF